MADNTITLSLWDVAEYLDLHDLELVRVLAISGKHHGYARQKKMVLGDSPTPSEEGDTTAHVKGNDNG